MNEPYQQLKPGSVWADTRPRNVGRAVVIDHVTDDGGHLCRLVDYTVLTIPASHRKEIDRAQAEGREPTIIDATDRRVTKALADEFVRCHRYVASKATLTDEDLAELVAAGQAKQLAADRHPWDNTPDDQLTPDQLRDKISWALAHPNPTIGRVLAQSALWHLAKIDPTAASDLFDQAQSRGHVIDEGVHTCVHCPRAAIAEVHGQATNLDPTAVFCSERCRDAYEADADQDGGWR